jgi:hypothetical protein
MPIYRVTFLKDIMGVPFPVASIAVRHARSPDRARQAAELRLMRRRQVPDWHVVADTSNVEWEKSERGSRATRAVETKGGR